MSKNPKLLSILFCGVIIALLGTSQVGRAALVVTRDGIRASSEPTSSPVSEENVPKRRHPRYPKIAKERLNTSKSSLRISSGASLSPGAKAFTGPPGDPADWILTFTDEFDGESLDPVNGRRNMGWIPIVSWTTLPRRVRQLTAIGVIMMRKSGTSTIHRPYRLVS